MIVAVREAESERPPLNSWTSESPVKRRKRAVMESFTYRQGQERSWRVRNRKREWLRVLTPFEWSLEETADLRLSFLSVQSHASTVLADQEEQKRSEGEGL